MAMDVQTFSSDFFPVARRGSQVQLGAFFSADLNLQTLEGDRVRIAFDTGQSLTQSRSETQVGGQVVSQQFSSVAIAASRYSIVVEGDLNKDELNAIQQLVDAIAPIAGDFFRNAEFDAENAGLILADNLGEIQSLQLGLERTVVATITGFEQVRNLHGSSPGNALTGLGTIRGTGDSFPGATGLVGAGFPNLANIRNLPELILAVLETELSAQAVNIFDSGEILKTLHDLLSFLRERFSIFGNPGRPPFVTQAEAAAEPEVDFLSNTEESAPPPEPEPAT